MFSQEKLLEIVSGRKKGFISSLTRMFLSCLTPLYRAAIWWRNRRFSNSQNDSSVVRRAGIPVISVGNLTTGGTGKTPMVIWISKWLRKQNLRVVLISRGYTANAAKSTGGNDEAIELESRLPDVPHLQAPNRYKMSQIAVDELESEIIVLDDGFQHRQLWRDLDIVLIDATEPFGFGRLLPRGLLREPVSALKRADIAILTRANLVSLKSRLQILDGIKQANDKIPIALTQTTFTTLLQFDGSEIPLERLGNYSSVFVFCAIGNPAGFRSTLEQAGANVGGFQTFRDHHEFSRDELDSVGKEARRCGAEAIICTHKDLVKVGTNRIEGLPVLAAIIDVEFISDEQPLIDCLQGVLDLYTSTEDQNI